MSDNTKTALSMVGALLGVFLGFYLVITLATANGNTITQAYRCEWTNGYGSERTGKYFEYNPWSLGTSGVCNDN